VEKVGKTKTKLANQKTSGIGGKTTAVCNSRGNSRRRWTGALDKRSVGRGASKKKKKDNRGERFVKKKEEKKKVQEKQQRTKNSQKTGYA